MCSRASVHTGLYFLFRVWVAACVRFTAGYIVPKAYLCKCKTTAGGSMKVCYMYIAKAQAKAKAKVVKARVNTKAQPRLKANRKK